MLAVALAIVVCDVAYGQGTKARVVNVDVAHVTGDHSQVPIRVVGAAANASYAPSGCSPQT